MNEDVNRAPVERTLCFEVIMEELTEHDDIVQDCNCHKCALAERDRLRELYKLSESVRESAEKDIRFMNLRLYKFNDQVRELENQLKQLRTFRSAN